MDKKISHKMKNKQFLILLPIFIFIYSLSTICLIASILKIKNVETFLRYIIIIFIVALLALMIVKSIKLFFKGKDLGILLFSLVLILIFAIQSFGCNTINTIYSSINKINKNMITYSTSLITMKDSEIKKLKDVKDKKIGIIDDKNSIDGYVISKEIINSNKLDKNNEIIEYETFASMLSDLYDKKLDLIFISSNYATMFSNTNTEEDNKYLNIKDETKIITTKSKQVEKNSNNKQESSLKNPFTILVMGVDSTEDDINSGSAFNGDALMLITFNPTTFNATILSIPRDTYVPIMCFKNKIENKITHAAWYGESCMISTIENFTGINIDYYVKINFKGVVKLVDALGGINVDVPYSFCEQNSDRLWGKNTVYVSKGYQKLNGEQALALARNRHPNPMCGAGWTNYESSDLIRGQNQQKVISSLINEIKNIRSLDEVYKLLDLVQKNVDTSLSTNQMLSFYNIAKDMLLHNESSNGDIVTFEHLFLEGHGQIIWDDGMRLPLWNYIYYKKSLKEIVNAMNINLENEEPTLIKDFYFSINEEYKQKIIGKGIYQESWIQVVGNFVGKNKSEAISWGALNNIKINIETVDTDDNYNNDEIINQSLPASYRVDSINKNTGLTIKIAKVVVKKVDETIDCSKKENSDNKVCLIPDFNSYTIETANNWKKSLTTSLIVTIDEVPLLPTDTGTPGKCYSKQSGKNITSLKEITITCYEK